MGKGATSSFLFVFVAVFLSVGSVFAEWDGESTESAEISVIDGTEYYIINSEAKLAWFAEKVNALVTSANTKVCVSDNAILAADLDMSGKLWTPIAAGKGNLRYCGIFDGGNHTISNLYLNGNELISKYNNNTTYVQNMGFIGTLGSGTVKNLVLKDVDVRISKGKGTNAGTGEISVGSLVGWLADQYPANKVGTIEGCYASGTIQTSGSGVGVGGIVGNAKEGNIVNSMSTVSIYANGAEKSYVGGIIGITKTNVNVSACVYAGTTLMNSGENGFVGAIVGEYRSGKLTTQDDYYDSEIFGDGVGNKDVATVYGVSNLNSEEVICRLNGGELIDGVCDKDSPWSVGENAISLNGSDGFRVVFNAKSGAFLDGAKTQVVFANGAKISSLEISTPVHADSAFAGWSLNENASEPDADLGNVSGPTVVYAVWYPIYTVTYDAAMGTFPDGDKQKNVRVAKGDMVSVTGIIVPETYVNENSEKFFFTGWAKQPLVFGEEDEISPEDTLHLDDVVLSGDTMLYAVWTKAQVYTVTYDANGRGKTKVDYVNVTKGEKLTVPPEPTPDKGYRYKVWCLDRFCNKEFNFDTTKITENYVLYAGWEAIEYSIAYVLNGGVNNADNPEKYTIESETIVLKKPAMEGNEFAGWFYDKDFTEKATQITHGSTGERTLYAKWNRLTYKIMYLSGNTATGTVSSDIKVHDEPIVLRGAVEAYDRGCIAQDGWSLADGGSLDYKLGATYKENKDLILYPHWEEGESINYGAVRVCKLPNGVMEAVIDGAYEGNDTLKIDQDVVVNKVTFNRDFNKNKISSIMLPFTISVARISGVAQVYKFNELAQVDGVWKVRVGSVDTVYANTPYMIIPSDNKIAFDVDEKVVFNTKAKSPIASVNGSWEFKGVYSYKSFEDDSELGRIYVFANVEQDGFRIGQFAKVGSGAFTRTFRGYLVNHASAMAKSANGIPGSALSLPDEINIEIEHENGIVETGKFNITTGILQMEGWYDMKGRKLNGKPTVKGSYYHNGKRIIVK